MKKWVEELHARRSSTGLLASAKCSRECWSRVFDTAVRDPCPLPPRRPKKPEVDELAAQWLAARWCPQ